MGIFSFFSKEKKETLDKGLSKTKENVFTKIARAIAGKSKVDDEVLDNLEEVLITSDVGVDTTLKIIFQYFTPLIISLARSTETGSLNKNTWFCPSCSQDAK